MCFLFKFNKKNKVNNDEYIINVINCLIIQLINFTNYLIK